MTTGRSRGEGIVWRAAPDFAVQLLGACSAALLALGCRPTVTPEPTAPVALAPSTPRSEDSPAPAELPPASSSSAVTEAATAPADSAAAPAPPATAPAPPSHRSALVHPVELNGVIAGDAYQGRFAAVDQRELYELSASNPTEVPFVRVPPTIRFLGSPGLVGTASPSGARLGSGCGGSPILELVFEEERPRWATLGIGGNWDPRPRQAAPVANPASWFRAVRQLLVELERPRAPVRITKIESVDLLGDGRPEVFLQAEHTEWLGDCRRAVTTPCRTGEPGSMDESKTYGVVAIAVDGAGPLSPIARWTGGVQTTIDFPFYADVDGDGTLEVVITSSYYEGHDASVYSLEGNQLREVLSMECYA